MFFQSLEITGKVFQPLEKFFPIIGNLRRDGLGPDQGAFGADAVEGEVGEGVEDRREGRCEGGAADEVVGGGGFGVAERDFHAVAGIGAQAGGLVGVEAGEVGVGDDAAGGFGGALGEELGAGDLPAAEGNPEAAVAEEDEGLARQVRETQGLAPRQGMHRREEDAEVLAQEGFRLPAAARRGTEEDGGVEGSFFEGRDEGGVGVGKARFDGLARQGARQQRGEDPHGHGRDGAVAEDTGGAVGFAHGRGKSVERGEDEAGVLGGEAPEGGEDGAPGGAVEEGRPEFAFEFLHGAAEGGLRDVQRLRRRREGPAPADFRDAAEEVGFDHGGLAPGMATVQAVSAPAPPPRRSRCLRRRDRDARRTPAPGACSSRAARAAASSVPRLRPRFRGRFPSGA